AIVDLKGKAGHARTVPMPGWVRALLDEWLRAAKLTVGKVFRRVNKNGSTWGDGLTEKAVWNVVREYVKRALTGLRRTTSGGHVLDSAILRVASWSRFSSCSGTSRFRRPSGTSAASSALGRPSMTALASSREPEHQAPRPC